MQKDWLKFKKYPHIGKPLTLRKDAMWVEKYVLNPSKIATHKFTPLLHRTMTQRKYRPEENASKNPSGKRVRTVVKPKQRDIYFASHLDSIIYSYYCYLLTQAYENYLEGKPYGSSAVAYRRIPIEDSDSRNKSNIEFAYEAFDFIEKNKNRKLSIIIADVTSFFDNLDHRILHSQWKRVLGVSDMPEDHYAVYKSLVNYKYVNENELFNRFKNKLIVERFKPNDTTNKELKRKAIYKKCNIRREGVVAFCDKAEFYHNATDLIRVDKPHKDTQRLARGKQPKKGIPQGTPVSATLANIYMLDFDERIHSEVSKPERRAYYQRYSDDLIIVCDQSDEQFFSKLVQTEIEDISKLEIQQKKTSIFRYEQNVDKIFTGGKVLSDGSIDYNKSLEYLGFAYDGMKVRVKTVGFSRFYRSMKRSFRRGAHFAKQPHNKTEKLYETRLYKRYTHIGAKRRLKWLLDRSNPGEYVRSNQYDWGNFISYANKANSIMSTINNDNSILRQYRKVWRKFHELRASTYADIKLNRKNQTTP